MKFSKTEAGIRILLCLLMALIMTLAIVLFGHNSPQWTQASVGYLVTYCLFPAYCFLTLVRGWKVSLLIAVVGFSLQGVRVIGPAIDSANPPISLVLQLTEFSQGRGYFLDLFPIGLATLFGALFFLGKTQPSEGSIKPAG